MYKTIVWAENIRDVGSQKEQIARNGHNVPIDLFTWIPHHETTV